MNPGKTTVENVTTALYAFSADPITFGHVDIVTRVSRTFDRVVVGIGRNPAKNYLFSLDERLAFARQALGHLDNVSVQAFQGMVVDFAGEVGARVIVKGVRNAADFDYEQVHHLVGITQRAGIDTHVLFADPALAHISSSAVKAIQTEHGFICDYVPLVTKAALEARLSGQVIIGVTGVAGAGKSTLCDWLVEAGQAVGVEVHNIDLDKLGHAILEDMGSALHRQTVQVLIEHFGREIALDGKIDRKRLALTVFGREEKLAELNRIMTRPMMAALRRALYGRRGLILLNGALLAEGNLLALCNNRVVLAEVDEGQQRGRLAKRGYSAAEIDLRIAAQWDQQRKRAAIDAAIARDRFGQRWQWRTENSGLDEARVLFADIIEATGTGGKNGLNG